MNWNHKPNYPFLPNFDFCQGVHHDNRNKTKSSSNISFKMILFTLQTVSQTRNLRSLAWQPLLSFRRPEHTVHNTEILRNPFPKEKRDEDGWLRSIYVPGKSSVGGQEEKSHIKRDNAGSPAQVQLQSTVPWQKSPLSPIWISTTRHISVILNGNLPK